jgi:amidohydrolase
MNEILSQAEEQFDYTQHLRRDFHRNPELGFQEYRTAGIVAEELRDLGLEVSTGIGQTGVVALLEGESPGPVLLLRFDMDALPIQEETGAEYASLNPGVMHACGHDGHTAIGLTVARLLNRNRQRIAGTIKFVFQPAEEIAGGAQSMVNGGVLVNPRPDHTLALHLWNEKPLGWYGVSPGPTMAAAEMFRIRVSGVGGHGASPHLTIDPIVAAAQIITGLQTIVARNIPPLVPAVLSITRIQGGSAYNVIPPTIEMGGTIRYFDPEIGYLISGRIQEIVENGATAMGCQAEIEVLDKVPAVINENQITSHVARQARDLFPGEIVDTNFQLMGSEDMSVMMNQIPGCYFFVGSADSERGLDAPHHHPKFDIDERALSRASALMAATVIDILSR